MFWTPLSSIVSCNLQIPISVINNCDSKDIVSKMYDCNSCLSWLAEYCPEFPVSSKNIQVLQEPSEFFEKLKEFSHKSTKRITLASLYIGTGSLERDLARVASRFRSIVAPSFKESTTEESRNSLSTTVMVADERVDPPRKYFNLYPELYKVACIAENLQKSSSQFKVKILLDYTRGSRGKENSRTLFLPLLQSHESQIEVSLYHTPKLRGFLKWLLPERWNETIGLSHLKVYLFDNTLILSGANLSDQYFTNRQDRYIIFHDCKALCDFFDELVSTVSSMSFLLKPDNSIALHPRWNIHPSEGNFKEFVSKAHNRLENFIQSAKKSSQASDFQENTEGARNDTLVYPLLQMYTFDIRQDEQVMEKFLCSAEPGSVIKLASGYFNLTNHYMNIILKSSKAMYNLLVASPKVNGFYGAKGVSGAIPMAYTHIAKTFFSKVLSYKQEKRIELHEYERPAWTFHVKGLWYYKKGDTLPSATFIGSPNFGYRSVYKDLEAQVALVTENKDLQVQLHEEQQRFYDRTTVIDKALFERPDRKVSLWVKLVTFFIRDFF